MRCPECESENAIGYVCDSGAVDSIDHPTKRCEKCGFVWNEEERKSLDSYVNGFCNKAILVLKMHDKRIANNILNTRHAEFYKNEYKGLGLFSTCERDLQYIIFIELCKYYPIWTEYTGGYKNKQRVDIALMYEGIPKDDGYEPDIAIEIKWAGFNKAGQLNSYSRQSLIDDVIKMKKNCTIPNKYFMQLSITKDILKLKDKKERQILEDSTNEIFYKNQFRNHRLEIDYFNYFETLGNDKNEYLNMLLWKIQHTL